MARRINLQSLIDEVLDMVKKKKEGDQGQNFEQRNWLSNEAYNKDIRARNTEVEKQKLVNTGLAERENISNAGALARQDLMNVGNESVANIHAGATRYAADLGLRGHETTAAATTKAAEINAAGKKNDLGDDKGFSTLMGKVIENDPSILSDNKRLNETASNIRSFFPPAAQAKDNYYTDTPLSRPVTQPPVPATTPVAPRMVSIQPTTNVQTPNPSVVSEKPKERLSAFGKRGFGLLNTEEEIAMQKPKQRTYFDTAKKDAVKFLSEEEKKKRRAKMGNWL